MQVRRVYNLQPFLGIAYSTYEVTVEREGSDFQTGRYLNYLADQTFYHYILKVAEGINENLDIESIINHYQDLTQKIQKIEQSLGE